MKTIALTFFLMTLPSFAQPWRTGYYYQPGSGSLPISAVPFSKYTHVIQYATLPTYNSQTDTCGIDATTYAISANASQFITAAHAAGAKAIVSMLNDSSASTIQRCTDGSHMSGFVSAVAAFINQYGYDGFDIDWEQGIIDSQYSQWIVDLRAAMPQKVLSVATVWNQRNVLSQVQGSLDQINLMNYDDDMGTVSGQWPTYSAYNSALYHGPDSDWQTADTMIYYNAASAGIAPSKLGLGIPFYARIKQGCLAGHLSGSTCSQAITDPGQPYASGNALSYPRTAINYNDLLNSSYWTAGTHVWDSTHGAQYIRYQTNNPSQDAFVPYTGLEQIQEAAKYVKAQGLGGVMTYDLGGEYLKTQTGDARYPLSTAIYNALSGTPTSSPTPPTPSTPPPPPPAPPPAPLTAQLTPATGSGSQATFKITLTDQSGYNSIQQFSLFIGQPGTTAHSCYLDYSAPTETLYLRNDNDSSWSQASVGGNTVLQNSQCKLSAKSITAVGSGSNLTLTIPMTFSPSYAGTKSVFTFVADKSGTNTNWQQGGTWTVK